jgi:hypothetical protein
MERYKVTTQDIDGSDTRYYKTFKGAAKRFEEMCGYELPSDIRTFKGISDYGCIVTFETI